MKKTVLDAEIEEVFVAEYCLLCFYAKNIIGNSEDAEDIVGDVFMKLYFNHNKIQITQTTKGYLYQCVRNGCLDYLKHKQIKRKFVEDAKTARDLYQQPDNNNPLDQMISEETQSEILHDSDRLPLRCREVVLAKIEGLSYQKIADKMGISVSAVKKHTAIARKTLCKPH